MFIVGFSEYKSINIIVIEYSSVSYLQLNGRGTETQCPRQSSELQVVLLGIITITLKVSAKSIDMIPFNR